MQPYQPPLWKTLDGRHIPVTEMEVTHIVNAYNMLRKKGVLSPSEVGEMPQCPSMSGEFAQMAAEAEWEHASQEYMKRVFKRTRWIDIFRDEIRYRAQIAGQLPRAFLINSCAKAFEEALIAAMKDCFQPMLLRCFHCGDYFKHRESRVFLEAFSAHEECEKAVPFDARLGTRFGCPNKIPGDLA